jgi:hypothetical protein
VARSIDATVTDARPDSDMPLTIYVFRYIFGAMEIVTTDEFAGWFRGLADGEAEDVTRAVNVLEAMGAACPRLCAVEVPLPLARKMPPPRVHELEVRGTPLRILLAMPADGETAAMLLYGYAVEEARRPSVGAAFDVPNVRRLAHVMLALKVYWLHIAARAKEAV